jgi:hypothetical protein
LIVVTMLSIAALSLPSIAPTPRSEPRLPAVHERVLGSAAVGIGLHTDATYAARGPSRLAGLTALPPPGSTPNADATSLPRPRCAP